MDGAWTESFWRRMTWREKHELVKAARAFDRAGKKPGARSGPLGSIALELLEELCTMAVNFEGRVRPSLAALQMRIRRSRDTVVRCLRRLAAAGIVEWVRRLVVREDAEPWTRGPQVEQTSNVYRLQLPAALRRFVRQAPPAADEATRKAETRARIEAHIREEAADRLDGAIARGRARGEAANRAAAKARERESDRRSETGQEKDKKASALRPDQSS